MPPRLRQVIWFALLWTGGVATVSVLAYGIRWWLSTT